MRRLFNSFYKIALMIVTLLTVLAMAHTAPSPPKAAERLQQPGPDPFVGVWTDGKALVTVRVLNDGYRVQWNREFGYPDLGVGMRRGNSLYVGYHTLSQIGPGLVRYELQQGKLAGEYLSPDAHTGSEELERIK